MTALWTTLAALGTIASFALHEYGHGYVLRRLGIPIESAGVGLPIGPMIELPPSAHRPYRLTASLLLIGAYVQPAEGYREKIAALSYRDTAWYSGIGVVVNFALAFALGSVHAALDGRSGTAALYLLAAFVIVLLPRLICAYVLPLLWPALVAIYAIDIATSSATTAHGMLGLAHFLVSYSGSEALLTVALVNLMLGMFNTLPLYPLDGGRIADAAIRAMFNAKAARVFRGATAILIAGVVLYALATDVLSLVF